MARFRIKFWARVSIEVRVRVWIRARVEVKIM